MVFSVGQYLDDSTGTRPTRYSQTAGALMIGISWDRISTPFQAYTGLKITHHHPPATAIQSHELIGAVVRAFFVAVGRTRVTTRDTTQTTICRRSRRSRSWGSGRKVDAVDRCDDLLRRQAGLPHGSVVGGPWFTSRRHCGGGCLE